MFRRGPVTYGPPRNLEALFENHWGLEEPGSLALHHMLFDELGLNRCLSNISAWLPNRLGGTMVRALMAAKELFRQLVIGLNGIL